MCLRTQVLCCCPGKMLVSIPRAACSLSWAAASMQVTLAASTQQARLCWIKFLYNRSEACQALSHALCGSATLPQGQHPPLAACALQHWTMAVLCDPPDAVTQAPTCSNGLSSLLPALQRAFSTCSAVAAAPSVPAAGAAGTSHHTGSSREPYDVCVVGAGMVGAALVALLRKCPAGALLLRALASEQACCQGHWLLACDLLFLTVMLT